MSLDASSVTGAGAARGTGQRVAHVLSELLAPWVCAAALPPVVGATVGHPWWRGALFGVMTAVFSAGIPYLLILWGVRRGRLTDRHVSRRTDRPLFLAVTVALVAGGLLLVHLLGGPAQLVALILAMIACALVGLVVSFWWKLSMHTVVLAGSVAVLTVVLGPWILLLGALVVAVGWARVVVRAHTPAQVAVGAVVGALIAGAIMIAS